MSATPTRTPIEVSTVRLYVLRAAYLLIAVGLIFMIWPLFLQPAAEVPHMNGVVRAMLGAVSLLAALGIRYPLKMLPVLYFELVWKSIWLLVYGLPLWAHDQLTPGTNATLGDCIFGVVVVVIALPWRYVLTRYVKEPGERWRRQTNLPAGSDYPRASAGQQAG